MQTAATLILNNPTTGVPEAYRLNLAAVQPGAMPTHLAGPFRFLFSLTDETNHNVEFEATVFISDKRCVAFFPIFPVICKVKQAFDIRHGERVAMLENYETGPTQLFTLDPQILGRTHVWIDLDGRTIMGGTYNAKTKTPANFPFYNYYDQLTVCMGNLNLPDAGPLAKLNYFVTALTTPHLTWGSAKTDGHCWNLDPDKRVITTRKAPRSTNCTYDLPDPTGKPIAIISP